MLHVILACNQQMASRFQSKKQNKLSSKTTNKKLWQTIHFVRFAYGNQKHKRKRYQFKINLAKQSSFTERSRSLTGMVLFQPYYMTSFESPAVACLPHIDVSKMRSQEKPNLHRLAITTER